MYLGIEKEPNKDLKPFCYWLIQKIEKTLVNSIDKKDVEDLINSLKH